MILELDGVDLHCESTVSSPTTDADTAVPSISRSAITVCMRATW